MVNGTMCTLVRIVAYMRAFGMGCFFFFVPVSIYQVVLSLKRGSARDLPARKVTGTENGTESDLYSHER